MSKEKRCFALKNAGSVRPGIGYVDDTGVYFSEGAISEVGRCSFNAIKLSRQRRRYIAVNFPKWMDHYLQLG